MRTLAAFVGGVGIAVVVAACGLDRQGLADDGPGADSGANDATSSSGGSSGTGNGSSGAGSSGGSSGSSSGVSGASSSGASSGSSSGGSSSGSSTGSSGSSSSGGIGSSSGGPPCTVANGCYVVPSGWTLVAFAGDRTTSCPQGSTQIDAFEGPTAGSGACRCTCAVSTQPTCPPGIAVRFDADGSSSCGLAGTPPTMGDQAACNSDMYTGDVPGLGYRALQLQYTPSPPTGGGCSSSTAQDAGAVTYAASDRVCLPATAPCTGDQCTPSFGSQLQVCISMAGQQTCPGSTFTVTHTVGTAATFTCSNACTCSLDAGECTGTVKLYTMPMCTGTELDVPAEGTCVNSGATSDSYVSYAYAANPLVASCTSGGSTSVQNLALPNLHTICCAP